MLGVGLAKRVAWAEDGHEDSVFVVGLGSAGLGRREVGRGGGRGKGGGSLGWVRFLPSYLGAWRLFVIVISARVAVEERNVGVGVFRRRGERVGGCCCSAMRRRKGRIHDGTSEIGTGLRLLGHTCADRGVGWETVKHDALATRGDMEDALLGDAKEAANNTLDLDRTRRVSTGSKFVHEVFTDEIDT